MSLTYVMLANLLLHKSIITFLDFFHDSLKTKLDNICKYGWKNVKLFISKVFYKKKKEKLSWLFSETNFIQIEIL